MMNAGQIGAYSQGSGNGGTIKVTATDLLLIDGKYLIGPGVSAGITAGAKLGNGGDVTVTAGDIEIIKGGEISTGSFGAGSGGKIEVTATHSLVIDGKGSREAQIKPSGTPNPISGDTKVFYGTGILALTYGNGEGGNITLQAPILSILGGGQVAAASFGKGNSGRVNLTAHDSLVIDGTGAVGNVLFDTGIFADAVRGSTGNGGDIAVRAGDIKIKDDGQIAADTFGGLGGDVMVTAESLLIDGGGLDSIAGIFARTRSGGNGGSVAVRAHDVSILAGARIAAVTQGKAPAGNVTVVADSLVIDGKGILDTGLFAIGSSSGHAGAVTVCADNVKIINAGQIGAYSQGSGDGGTIKVTATDSLLIDAKRIIEPGLTAGIFADAATGKGGDITVKAGNVKIVNDGEISSGTFGSGSGGNITVTATHSLVVDGTGSKEGLIQPSGTPNPVSGNASLFFGTGILAFGYGTGNGGKITLNAPTLSIVGGGQAAAASFGTGNGGSVELNAKNSLLIDGSGAVGNVLFGTGIFAGAEPGSSGPGGEIIVTATEATLTNNGQISSANTGTGDAGKVKINITDAVTLKHGSIISTASTAGNAGDITLDAGGEIKMKDRSSITGSAAGTGGNILITTPALLYLLESEISAVADGGGGNFQIDSQTIVLNDSAIRTNAPPGQGGNQNLNSDFFFRSNSNIIATGTINITAPDLDLGAQLITLPSSLLSAANQLQERCTALLRGDFSSFISIGRGGIEPAPEELQTTF